MQIAIGADHAGYELKNKLVKFLEQAGHDVYDAGAYGLYPTDDYPDFALKVAERVANGDVDRGILICDSGIGVDIVANKVPGIRSALVNDERLAKLTREHNNSNVLSLGAMLVDEDKAKRIVDEWMRAIFSEADRHKRRLEKISEIERREVLLHEEEMKDDGGE